MTDRRFDDEREALIAEARPDGLEPHEVEELALLADLLGDPSTWAEPNAGLEDAIVQAVLDAPPSTADSTASGPTASNWTTGSVVGGRAARERRADARRSRRIMYSVIAAAAAIAIVAGAVTVLRREPRPMFRSRLTATALAPAAHASAEIYRNAAGFHVTLNARGLSKLPSGEYYEAWLKNAQGTLVSIGSFSSSDGDITLWSGVSPIEFDTMSVTIEKTDGDPGSSGQAVLRGPIGPV